MSKTLVVGGNGYIGSHMKQTFPDYIYAGRKEFDLKDKNKIIDFISNTDIDTCIILAATISYEKDIDFNKEPFTTNLYGLNNLLLALQKKTKVIYFSTMTVYNQYSVSPVTETCDLIPLHSYGLSKVYAEELLRFYNFKSVIIRIPGIFGGNRESGLIYNTIQKMKNNHDIEIDTTELGYWETMHIDDMIKIFSQLISNYKYTTQLETFNISYGEKTDIIETINFIQDILKSQSKINIDKKYKELYLSNEKILKYVSPPIKYFDRLKLYIKENV